MSRLAPALQGPQTVQQWFNTGAFEAPAAGFFGNAGRNLLRGPGIHNWDMSLFKTFAASDRVNVQFRAEAFNLFNHTNLDAVSTHVRRRQLRPGHECQDGTCRASLA